MVTLKQQTGGKAVKLAMAIFVSAIVSGCTTSRLSDQTASSTHVDNAALQQNAELEAAKQPNGLVLAGAENTAIDLENSTSSSARSGVIYQENLDNSATGGLPVQTAANPGNANQQLASLENTPTHTGANTNVLAYASQTQSDKQKEFLAQQRIDAINSQMIHGACESGWATPPEKLDASRITPGHPYYMEIRLRNTPLFPVGHTYIAYGRLSADGEPMDENLVLLSPLGGYGGAAIAAALPVPGILTPFPDDCRIKPHAAYRVTLDAQKYEQLLLRIQQAQKKTPAYLLFAYNCNNFVADIVASVGILPAENRFLPAVKYLYGMIEANEGKDWKKRQPS